MPQYLGKSMVFHPDLDWLQSRRKRPSEKAARISAWPVCSFCWNNYSSQMHNESYPDPCSEFSHSSGLAYKLYSGSSALLACCVLFKTIWIMENELLTKESCIWKRFPACGNLPLCHKLQYASFPANPLHPERERACNRTGVMALPMLFLCHLWQKGETILVCHLYSAWSLPFWRQSLV